uniref:C2H2-type domain-containing protein n=1 Tax=Cacopsylla melanoneura TaxID=428564 RepID=A0A8D8Z9R3_9HEMI
MSHVLVFADEDADTTHFDLYGEKETHWLETMIPWKHEDKVEFLKDFWYKPVGYIRTRTFPTNWDAFMTILDDDLETREVLDCIHCGEPVNNMMKYMRKHAATCPKLKHFQLQNPQHNYLCPKCNDTCKRNLTMEVHLKYNHYCKNNNESEEFHCNQCNVTVFPDLERLHYHKRLHYNTPVFKIWNDTHTMPWTVPFKDVLPNLYKGNTEEKYEQDMSTDELELLMDHPQIFDEGSLAIEEYLQKEINDSIEVRNLILSGNTQWQVDIAKKYENMSTQYLRTRSIDEILEQNRKHFIGERKKLGLEVDYFCAEKYTNKYTTATHPLMNPERLKSYEAKHDWNKTRVEAFEEFDRMQDNRRYSILCHHMGIPYTEPTYIDEFADSREEYTSDGEPADCSHSHYPPDSQQTSKPTFDPNSKDWKFTPL